ncbi:biotin/lipoyl-binding protein [Verticiella sediminum]|uniref:Biotin/lipoyl-binding protein n=1 Tax=Verticiella sediminum TaxID=1247510 RepID=A0A556B0D0_9BURK|nr:acetyl-CoA carboxylase biotin carboxyl carrier protein subunit [Verticiella sediminum]TSH98651.1 biotin/lipoyl-binding protein [Verticiella sediminum]
MPKIDIVSEVTGRVWKIEANVGDAVDAEQTVVIVESMKMEIPVAAPAAGRVAALRVAEGDAVEEGQAIGQIDT